MPPPSPGIRHGALHVCGDFILQRSSCRAESGQIALHQGECVGVDGTDTEKLHLRALLLYMILENTFMFMWKKVISENRDPGRSNHIM